MANGDISKPYEYGCKIQKKRLECAIIIQAILSDEANAGGEDLRPEIDNFKFKV